MKLRSLLLVFILNLCAACKPSEQLFDASCEFQPLMEGEIFRLDQIPEPTRWIVINFFAPECPPCIEELPALQKFYLAHRESTVLRFVAIGSLLEVLSLPPERQPARQAIIDGVLNFRKRFRLPYPVYYATAHELHRWKVTGFPESFVFRHDTEGWTLRRKFISAVTKENLEDALR